MLVGFNVPIEHGAVAAKSEFVGGAVGINPLIELLVMLS
jgi:hypothetical protein